MYVFKEMYYTSRQHSQQTQGVIQGDQQVGFQFRMQLRSRQGNLASQTAQDAKIQATESYPKSTAKLVFNKYVIMDVAKTNRHNYRRQ